MPRTPKTCEKCGKTFQPKGNYDRWCETCRTLICPICEKAFLRIRAVHLRSNSHYCSSQCYGIAQHGKAVSVASRAAMSASQKARSRSGSFVSCSSCRKKVYRFPRDFRLQTERGFTKWFCSRKCSLSYARKHNVKVNPGMLMRVILYLIHLQLFSKKGGQRCF